MKFILYILLFRMWISSDGLTEQEIIDSVKRIDNLRIQNKLTKCTFPDMSGCGGDLNGYYLNKKLVYIDATFRAELGYSQKIYYLKDSTILKISCREYFAEWGKHAKKYSDDENFKNMTYTDTTYSFIMTEPVKYIITSANKAISKKNDIIRLNSYLECAKEMRIELETNKICN